MGRERPKFRRYFFMIQEEDTRKKVLNFIAETAFPPSHLVIQGGGVPTAPEDSGD